MDLSLLISWKGHWLAERPFIDLLYSRRSTNADAGMWELREMRIPTPASALVDRFGGPVACIVGPVAHLTRAQVFQAHPTRAHLTSSPLWKGGIQKIWLKRRDSTKLIEKAIK